MSASPTRRAVESSPHIRPESGVRHKHFRAVEDGRFARGPPEAGRTRNRTESTETLRRQKPPDGRLPGLGRRTSDVEEILLPPDMGPRGPELLLYYNTRKM